MILGIVLSVAAVLLLLARVETTPEHDSAHAFLATVFEITSTDIARIDRGQVVSRTIDVEDKREVATLGVVRVRMTPEFYVERLADIVNFKRDEAVLQIGAFGDPADVEHVAHLTLEESDLENLRECRVGRCGVQLSADGIQRFRRDVDWQRSDATRQANSLMREILVEYVTGYRKGGTPLTMEYADVPEPVNVGREFASLAESRVIGWQHFPQLLRHLLQYPARNPAPIADLVYWSKEKLGRRAVLSVTHLAIARTAGDSLADYAIASKHIYGSHYFDASLGLTVLVRDRSATSPATYLAYFNRSRVDVFGGLFGGITRKVVTSRARSTVSDQLERIQRTLELQFAGGPTH